MKASVVRALGIWACWLALTQQIPAANADTPVWWFPTNSHTVRLPTNSPTERLPTNSPTKHPTKSPTVRLPTNSPTERLPTGSPTKHPTKSPTERLPTSSPTGSCTNGPKEWEVCMETGCCDGADLVCAVYQTDNTFAMCIKKAQPCPWGWDCEALAPAPSQQTNGFLSPTSHPTSYI